MYGTLKLFWFKWKKKTVFPKYLRKLFQVKVSTILEAFKSSKKKKKI